MGNNASAHLPAILKRKVNGKNPLKWASKSSAISHPCKDKCLLYQQTQHCCKQICLRERDREEWDELTAVWIFTNEHEQMLEQSLTDLQLQDVAGTIKEFLSGITSTLDEFNIFCHGISAQSNKICKIWLQTKCKQISIEILGASKVGKSALALKCAKNMYNNNRNGNIAATNDDQTMYVKLLKLDDITLRIGIFDINQSQSNGIDCIYVLCIDPSSDEYRKSFHFIEEEILYIRNAHTIDSGHDAIKYAFIVVATKCDLKTQLFIKRSESMILYCKDANIPYCEVSAKKGINIDLFLKTCVYELWVQSQTGCSI